MAKAADPRSVTINLRVTEKVKHDFWERASRYGVPTEILRELIDAFIDGRLNIEPRNFGKEANVTRVQD